MKKKFLENGFSARNTNQNRTVSLITEKVAYSHEDLHKKLLKLD